MSMFRIFDISGSAMSAQSVRLNTTASNLANANTPETWSHLESLPWGRS